MLLKGAPGRAGARVCIEYSDWLYLGNQTKPFKVNESNVVPVELLCHISVRQTHFYIWKCIIATSFQY